MIRYNVLFWRTRQAVLARDVPISDTRPAWVPRARLARGPSPACIGGSALLHLIACCLLVRFVEVSAVPEALDNPAVAVVFAPTPEAIAARAPPLVPVAAAALPPVPEPPSPLDAPMVAPVALPDATAPEALMPPPPPVANPSASVPAIPPPPAAAIPPVRQPTVPRRHTAVARPAAPRPQAPPAAGPPAAPPRESSAPPSAPAPSAAAPIAADWQRALAVWLATHKTYPEEARRSGAQGGVVLRFTVERSGLVLDVVLVRSAGSAVLDAAAAAMVRGATLPAFTATMPQERITVTVQVHYALTE